MKKLYFLSSLPRSGSTLLARIFSQNPLIYASPTSPLIDILLTTRNSWSEYLEHKACPNPNLTYVLRAIIQSYYHNVEKPIIIDKSRTHNTYLNLWEHLLEEKPKVIITIRDLPDIISSIEKLYQQTSLQRQPAFEREFYWQMQHLEGRVGIWTMPEQIIGLAYNRVCEAINKFPEYLHIVHYDDLTKYPKETLKKIYRFLGEKDFQHDFDNVPTVNPENDDINGFNDLHTTRAKVTYKPSDARQVLGNNIYDKYSQFNLQAVYPGIC